MHPDAQNGTDEGDQPTDGQSDGQLKRSHVEFSVPDPELGQVLALLANLMIELEPRRVLIALDLEQQKAL
jgi:hypothetical protein